MRSRTPCHPTPKQKTDSALEENDLFIKIKEIRTGDASGCLCKHTRFFFLFVLANKWIINDRNASVLHICHWNEMEHFRHGSPFLSLTSLRFSEKKINKYKYATQQHLLRSSGSRCNVSLYLLRMSGWLFSVCICLYILMSCWILF